MSRRAPSICTVPNCPNVATARGRCPTHRLSALHGRDGSTRRWRKLRTQALRRDNYQCTISDAHGHRCTTDAGDASKLEVDHIVPLAHGGSDTLANVRVLCRDHHTARHRDGGGGHPQATVSPATCRHLRAEAGRRDRPGVG